MEVLVRPGAGLTTTSYHIRNYRAADFDGYVQLVRETEKSDRAGRCTSRKALADQMKRPRFDPERDIFVAEAEGKIIGFIALTPETFTRRVLVECLVHPEHRRRGVAGRLLEQATRRATEMKAMLMHVSVDRDNRQARALLSGLGFRMARRFLEMKLELDGTVAAAETSGDLVIRLMRRGEEEMLTRLQNRAFTGTWGYNPNTIEDTAYWLRLCGGSPEDVVLVLAENTPAGYCWTRLDCDPAPPGHRKGYVFMLGVDPAYRGRGIGRLALKAGLSHLKDKGVRTVELTVDSRNNAAHRLYLAAGFEVRTSSLYYEKKLEPAA